LLEQEKDGRARLYRVRTDKLDVLRRWLGWFDGAQENDEGGADASTPPSKKRRKSSG
jgi:hypothetical protein